MSRDREEPGRVHQAGPPAGRYQRCLRCAKVLAEDDPNALKRVGQGPPQAHGPRWWPPGWVTFYGEEGGYRQVGIGEGAVACDMAEAG